MEENSTWKSCISTKYGTGVRGWFTGSFGVGLWKAIAKEAAHLKQDCELVVGMARG